MGRKPIDTRCSFCGKTKDKVSKLIAGPGVYICDECVGLCNEILKQDPPVPPTARPGMWSRILWRSGQR